MDKKKGFSIKVSGNGFEYICEYGRIVVTKDETIIGTKFNKKDVKNG